MKKIELVIKSGTAELIALTGLIDVSNMRLSDADNIIEVEQFLERITGYRFHIHFKEE